VQGLCCQALAQGNVVNGLAVVEGVVCGDDGYAGWECFRELRLEGSGGSGSGADYLVEVSHHYEALCGQLREDCGQAFQVGFVVLPSRFAVGSSVGLRAAAPPWDADAESVWSALLHL